MPRQRSELDLHLIVDNYGTHKHPRVNRGSDDIHASISTSRRPQLVVKHGRAWFRELTEKRIRRGSL